MAKLVIDPEVDDYDHALELLDVLYGRTDAETEPDTEDEADTETEDQSVPILGFTPKRMRRYVQNLTVDGHKILRYIAENAPRVEMDDVQAAVGFTPQVYAGRMSTFGHAKRLTRGVNDQPFSRHYRVYSMDPRVAKMAIEALDQLGL